MKPRIVFHVVAVIVLAAAVAVAQSPKDKEKPTQTNAPQNRQMSIPSVSEREAGSGMATGKRQHEPITITAREASSGMATGRREAVQDHDSGQPAAYESGVVTARETGSGMATGRRSGSIVVAGGDDLENGAATGKPASGDPHEYLNSRNSAHATESLDAGAKDAGKLSRAQSNPLYQDRGMQGTNPLYQDKNRTAAPPSNNGSKPTEYKDGEDGTTHTRPGNHKPAR